MSIDELKEYITNKIKVSNENPYFTKNIVNFFNSVQKEKDLFNYIDIINDYNYHFGGKNFIDNDKEDYYNGLDKPEYHNSFLELLKKISSIMIDDEKKIRIIIRLLSKYILVYPYNEHYPSQLIIYNQWVNSNMKLINNNYKIGYIYHKIIAIINEPDYAIHHGYNHYQTLTYDGYVNINKRMENLYKTLVEIFPDNYSNDSNISEENTTIKDTVQIPKENSLTSPSSYDDILFEQIKELQMKLDESKKENDTLKKEKEELSKKFSDMQSRIKEFIGV
jgi:hypothetical protein